MEEAKIKHKRHCQITRSFWLSEGTEEKFKQEGSLEMAWVGGKDGLEITTVFLEQALVT